MSNETIALDDVKMKFTEEHDDSESELHEKRGKCRELLRSFVWFTAEVVNLSSIIFFISLLIQGSDSLPVGAFVLAGIKLGIAFVLFLLYLMLPRIVCSIPVYIDCSFHKISRPLGAALFLELVLGILEMIALIVIQSTSDGMPNRQPSPVTAYYSTAMAFNVMCLLTYLLEQTKITCGGRQS
jgi:hypothetical protein